MKKLFFLLIIPACVIACNNSGSSSGEKTDSSSMKSNISMDKHEQNAKTALEDVQAFSAHDIDGALAHSTTDAIDYGDGSMPPVKNMDSIKTFLKAFVAAFPDVKGENLTAYANADGSQVVVVGEWRGTFKNDFMGMKATGKSYKVWDGDIFTFNDEGKITSHRAIQSNMTIWAQVGAKMSK